MYTVVYYIEQVLEHNKQGLYEKGVQYGPQNLVFLIILHSPTKIIADLTLHRQIVKLSRLSKNSSYFLHMSEI